MSVGSDQDVPSTARIADTRSSTVGPTSANAGPTSPVASSSAQIDVTTCLTVWVSSSAGKPYSRPSLLLCRYDRWGTSHHQSSAGIVSWIRASAGPPGQVISYRPSGSEPNNGASETAVGSAKRGVAGNDPE